MRDTCMIHVSSYMRGDQDTYRIHPGVAAAGVAAAGVAAAGVAAAGVAAAGVAVCVVASSPYCVPAFLSKTNVGLVRTVGRWGGRGV